MQMEKIDQLQKELMLPRNINKKAKNNMQGLNRPKINQDNQMSDYGEFRQNINANLIEQPSSNHYQKLKIGALQNKQKKFNNMSNMSEPHSQNVMKRRNSPLINNGGFGYQNGGSMKKSPIKFDNNYQQRPFGKPVPLVQQDEPVEPVT